MGIILPGTTQKIMHSSNNITTIFLRESPKTREAFTKKYGAKIVKDNEEHTYYENGISRYKSFKKEKSVEKFLEKSGAKSEFIFAWDAADDYGTQTGIFIVKAKRSRFFSIRHI